MIEAARVLAGLAAIMLVLAAATWFRRRHLPVRQPVRGDPAPHRRMRTEHAEVSSQLLVGAVAMSGFAAILAVASWTIRMLS